MCGEAMMRREMFEKDFKVDMLKLVNDRVVNVRLNLAKVIRHHFLSQINGAFVFDLEVNDAVRLLNMDKSLDVVDLVADIQTFPINADERKVEMQEFLERLGSLTVVV
jgi:hypothetical protein